MADTIKKEIVELSGKQLDTSLPNNDSRAYSSSSSSSGSNYKKRSRKRSRSSRSYSKKRSKKSRRHSRSRSQSRCRRFFRSRSTEMRRKRYFGSRENPESSRCLGVFGLSINTDERKIHEIFSRFGHIERVNIVFDAKSCRSRGFGFVYFLYEDDAFQARRKCNGIYIDERCIRVDYSITHRAHTPTPGMYMGIRKSPMRGELRKSRRSRSSSYRRRRSRSRSRR